MKLKKYLKEDKIILGECTQCGECCQHIRMIFTNEQMNESQQDKTLLEGRGILRRLDENRIAWDIHSKCKHLGEDNLCKIYEDRPQHCRDHPNCLDEMQLGCGFRIIRE